MADVNYLNPSSFIPPNDFKADGPLGGVQWYDQSQDYRKMMEQQFFLQELAKKRAAIETGQLEADVPLKNLQRQASMTTLGAQIPGLGDQARAAQGLDIAKSNFGRDVTFGPEAKKFDLLKMTEGVDEIKQKQFLTEVTHAGRIANDALNVAKNQGEAAAIGYVQQQMARAKEAGINLPNEIANPKLWTSLQQAGVQSIGHLQEMEKVTSQNTSRERVAEITGLYHLAGAKVGADKEKNQNPDQLFASLERKRAAGQLTPEEQSVHKGLLADRWIKQVDSAVTQSIMTKTPLSTETLDKARDEYFARHGYSKSEDKNNAKVASFATVEEAVAAGKKSGDTVIINGVQGKLK